MKILSVIAGLLVIIAFVPYARAILRKETRPAKASWIIWAILDTIAFAGMYAKQAVNGQILGAVIGIWVIVALALKYGTPGWTKLDKVCFGGAILGITFWQVFDSPVVGIMISCGLLFLGSIPTFASAWKNPSHENKLAWTIFWLSCVVAVIAIPQWTLADATQPIMFLIIESTMMYILFIRPRFKFAN